MARVVEYADPRSVFDYAYCISCRIVYYRLITAQAQRHWRMKHQAKHFHRKLHVFEACKYEIFGDIYNPGYKCY